ncbi:FKBP-type peptidyl-prolyl cis-trans isomerase domain [Dillenia turbinata]|uniref:peptidylprolyl isomerase n=1 Tax=Dillenia turbinata TaxID=194707 RepID=A0AAN8ZMS3_9MAGN
MELFSLPEWKMEFKMKSEMHYEEADCPLLVPNNFSKDDEVYFDIELTDFSNVRANQFISEDLGILKKETVEGQGWESPREPYEVKAWISAKTADGNLIMSHTGEIPKGLEMGIGTMSRGEKAVLYVTNRYLTESPFMSVEGLKEVHFEAELVHFIQVQDMLGHGRLIKCHIHDGKGNLISHLSLVKMGSALTRLINFAFEMNFQWIVHFMTVFYESITKACFLTKRRQFPMTQNSIIMASLWNFVLEKDYAFTMDALSMIFKVPKGLEMSARLMLPGERALVTCPPDYAYEKFPSSFICYWLLMIVLLHVGGPANVPEGSHVQWEIELLGFEMSNDWTGLNFESIMNEAEKIRPTVCILTLLITCFLICCFQATGCSSICLPAHIFSPALGTDFKYELAKAKYEKALISSSAASIFISAMILALQEYNHFNPQDDEGGKVFVNTRNLLHLNMANCYLKLGECRKSIESCNKVLNANPVRIKALYHHEMALMLLGESEDARNDFAKEAERKAKKHFKGLFDKKPGEIAEAGDKIVDEPVSERSHEIRNSEDLG